MLIPIQEDQLLAMFGFPGGTEWIVILGVGLLLFGKRLPEIARSMGKGIVEFKKGLRDVEDEIDRASSSTGPDNSTPTYSTPDYGETGYGGESDGNRDGYGESESHSDSDASTRENYEAIYGQEADASSGETAADDAPTEAAEPTADDAPTTGEVPAESDAKQSS